MFLGDIAASDLWKQIIDTREALAALRNSAGTPDSFVVPAGLVRTSDGPDGGNTGNVLASKITSEILGRPFTSIHNVKRADWNAALAAMNATIQTLKSPTGTSTGVAPSVPTVTTGAPATLPAPVPNVAAGMGSLLTGNTLIYVLVGGAAIYMLMQRKGGGLHRSERAGIKRMPRRHVRVVRKRSRKARR